MIILILMIMIGSMIFFLAKIKNMLSFWMLTLYCGCFFVVLGYMYYFAKIGSLSKVVNMLLFINTNINRELMYLPIPLDNISLYIVVGRSIFMFSNLCFAIQIFFYRTIRENLKWFIIVAIVPILNMICYNPVLYRKEFVKYYEQINAITRGCIVIYTLITFTLILLKYKKINIPWIKRQLKYILLAVISINVLFYSFGFFGTLQVADHNSLGYLYFSFASLQSSAALFSWLIIITCAVIFTGIGFVSLWNYAKVEKQIGKPDLFLERKLKTAHMGARIFTHGIKNQLLVSRVMLEKTKKEIEKENFDKDKVTNNLIEIEEINSRMLNRMDVLYKTFKTNAMSLRPTKIVDVIEESISKVKENKNMIELEFKSVEDKVILADIEHLTEAIYNIIINAIDAIAAKNNLNRGKVEVACSIEDNSILITISDNGIGIPENKLNTIFDPFYTDKNTNTNWGVGLSYAQQAVNSHFGYIRINSKVGEGTTFFIFLPVYKMNIN